MRKRLKMRREAERRDVFERYIGEIAQAVNALNGTDPKKLYDALLAQAKKRTAIADLELDEEGKAKRGEAEDPADQEGVIIVGVPQVAEAAGAATKGKGEREKGGKGEKIAANDPFAISKAEAARLKVAAMRDDDEAQPKLLDVAAPKRLTQKGKVEGKKGSTAKGTKEETKPAKREEAAKAAAPATPDRGGEGSQAEDAAGFEKREDGAGG
jgi:hypothetical protein